MMHGPINKSTFICLSLNISALLLNVNASHLYPLPLSTSPHTGGLQTRDKISCGKINQSFKASSVVVRYWMLLQLFTWDHLIFQIYTDEYCLFFRFTQMNVAFIFITQLLIICILQYPFHPLTMYDILKTPVFCKFKSSKNCEGSLELRGMIFLYYLFVWVIVKKSFFNIHTYKMFSLVFACFMCSISICTEF